MNASDASMLLVLKRTEEINKQLQETLRVHKEMAETLERLQTITLETHAIALQSNLVLTHGAAARLPAGDSVVPPRVPVCTGRTASPITSGKDQDEVCGLAEQTDCELPDSDCGSVSSA